MRGRKKLRALREPDGTHQLRGYVRRYVAMGGILGGGHLELPYDASRK
jgi:hypothetical protein